LKNGLSAPYIRHARTCAINLADANMQIVYSSQNYHVIEYPESAGFELINKSAHAGTYLHGQFAAVFRDGFAKAVAEDPSVESVDEFLGGFDDLMILPTTLH
jgi:hypothetical protein